MNGRHPPQLIYKITTIGTGSSTSRSLRMKTAMLPKSNVQRMQVGFFLHLLPLSTVARKRSSFVCIPLEAQARLLPHPWTRSSPKKIDDWEIVTCYYISDIWKPFSVKSNFKWILGNRPPECVFVGGFIGQI